MFRIWLMACMILFLVIMAGCGTDAKQAGVIYQKIEKAASYEADFSEDQRELNKTKEKEQEIYAEILDLDITNTGVLDEKTDEANKYVQKQEESIANAQEHFDDSYDVLKTISASISGINDKEQRDLVKKMGDFMSKRKKLIDSYLEGYQQKLDLHDSFYANVAEEDWDADELDKQVGKMNKQEQDLEELIEKFNQVTKQYNQAKGDYYQLVDLTEKDVEKADAV